MQGGVRPHNQNNRVRANRARDFWQPEVRPVRSTPTRSPFISESTSAAEPIAPSTVPRTIKKKYWSRPIILVACLVSLVLIGGVVTWLLLSHHSNPKNKKLALLSPFSQQLMSSLSFPLYYPAELPHGFHFAAVTEPKLGIIILTLQGTGKQKLFITEEAPPKGFSIADYTGKFSDSKKATDQGAELVVGKISGGTITVGSLVSKKTWVLANDSTGTNFPVNQFMAMMQSLTTSSAKPGTN
jgi:hypothetical protein